MTDASSEALHTVLLLEFPLPLYLRAQEHHADLVREFAYVAEPNDPDDVPDRLMLISASLRERFGAFTSAPDAVRDAALARGETKVDLEFNVPEAVAAAADDLSQLLDEADNYCRRGDLLTLATPPDLVAFRRWYLAEFGTQIAGGQPTPWSRVAANLPAPTS